jgi:hypothetical protein
LCRAAKDRHRELAREERRAVTQRHRAEARGTCSTARTEASEPLKRAKKHAADTRESIEAARLVERRAREQRRADMGLRPGMSKSERARLVYARRREAEAESAHEVERDIEARQPDLMPVWQRVRHRIKPGPRRSRLEAWWEWVHDHGQDVRRILEAELRAAEAEARRYEREAKRGRWTRDEEEAWTARKVEAAARARGDLGETDDFDDP